MFVGELKESLEKRPYNSTVIVDGRKKYSAGRLIQDVKILEEAILKECHPVEQIIVGVAMKSSYEWIVSMLAIHFSGATLLPTPIEFSDSQIKSLLGKADLVFAKGSDIRGRLEKILPDNPIVDPLDFEEGWGVIANKDNRDGAQGLSIIHTSGTTSNPKGVVISESGIDALLASLWPRIPSGPLNCASVVPMSLLIEQVTGAYIPLLTGGRVHFLPEDLPEFGAESTQLLEYIDHIESCEPNFGYLPPALVNAISAAGLEKASKLRSCHIITGGASLQANILESLKEQGFKVFEAYGMSENSSMISLNYEDNNRIGTAGKLLPHVSGRIVDGELEIKSSSLCLGYYNADGEEVVTNDGWFKTGDLCEFDDQECLKVVGRKKHLIILSSARNVSAEWVEKTYKELDGIEDMIVMGEGKSDLGAVVLTQLPKEKVKERLSSKHEELANYAQVHRFVAISDVKNFQKSYFTVTGRPRRQAISQDFTSELWGD